MKILKAIELTNVVCYDHARIDLDKHGVTLIYGRNKDSGQDEKKSNGAGKTLPFTMLCETIMDQNPLLDGRHIVKDGFGRKDALAAVEWDDYRIEKSVPGKTPKFDLLRLRNEEWVPTKVRTTKYVQAKMAGLMPLSSSEFFSLYFIDSSRPSDLQRGSHATRLQLFSKLFNLEKYDLIQADIKEQLKALRKDEQKLSTVLDQIAMLEPQIPDDLETKISELEAKREKQSKLNKRRATANRLLNLATTYNAHRRTLEDLDVFWKKLGKKMGMDASEVNWVDPDFLNEFVSAAREGHQAIKKALTKAYAHQHAQVKIDDARQRVAKLKKQVGNWDMKSVKKQLALADDYADDRSEYEQALKQLKKRSDQLTVVDEPEQGPEETRALLKEAFPGIKLVDLLDHAQSVMQGAKAIADMSDRSMGKFEEQFVGENECKCPTCHAGLDAATIKDIHKNLKNVRAAKHKEYAQALANYGQAKAYTSWMDYIRERTMIEGEYANLVEPQMYDGPDIEEMSEVKQALTLLAREQEALDELEAALAEEAGDPEELSERQMAYKNASLNAEALLGSWRALAEAIEVGAGEYNVDELEEGLASVDKTIERLMKDVPTLTQQVSVAQQVKRQLQAANAEKARLEQQLFDMPILKAFDEAYGQKGLKNLAIQRVCQTIESNLNVNASLLFDEPIRFSIEVSETQVNIMAHRKWQKEDVDVDIRRLSGAESRAINLLLPMCILPLIPSERRLNIMVLDEPTANMDDPAVEMFVNKFLPKLRELVPHVIVLSPLQLPVDIDDAEVLIVTRENGVSTIEKAA